MKIKVIIKRPTEPIGHMIHIDGDDYKVMQKIVGGPFETVTVARGWTIFCHANGRILDNPLPYNCRIAGIDFVGTIVITGVKGPDLTDVPMTFEEYEEMLWRENS